MKNIVFCGYNVFPIGYAQTQRLLLIAKGLNEQKVNVHILCKYGTYSENGKNVEASGNYENIPYLYCSGESFRRSDFFRRNIKKFRGVVLEFVFLFKKRIAGQLDYIFVSTNSFENAIYYFLLSKVLFTKAVIDNTEYWSSVNREKINFGDKIYDFVTPILYDKVICISDFLFKHTLKFKNEKNILKIPAIVDFSKFSSETQKSDVNNYILFCGSAVYFEIIDFIISSFEALENGCVKLVLVSSNGSNSDFEKLNIRIDSSPKKNLIVVKRDLSYEILVSLYKNSIALLIPLRPTIEDMARFPHKLGEYTASKSIIVTTNFGEIPNYFVDLKNALIANKYSIEEYAAKINFAIEQNDAIEKMKMNSFEIGLLHFDYKNNGKKTFNFLFTS